MPMVTHIIGQRSGRRYAIKRWKLEDFRKYRKRRHAFVDFLTAHPLVDWICTWPDCDGMYLPPRCCGCVESELELTDR